MEVIRGTKHLTIPVTIGELKDQELASARGEDQPGSGWGLQVGEITPDIAREFNLQSDKGIVVRQVRPDSPGAEAGLQQGDVILEVNHQKINSLQDFMARAKESQGPEEVGAAAGSARQHDPLHGHQVRKLRPAGNLIDKGQGSSGWAILALLICRVLRSPPKVGSGTNLECSSGLERN